jgi:RNA polymerase sigma-70 factor, ECF subfamily
MTNFPAARVYVLADSDDAQLAVRGRRGDAAAFESLVQRYHRVLFNVALRMLGNRDEAADATQETFLKAYEHLESYDADRRFFSWIYRILANTCLNMRRSQRPYPALAPDAPVAPGPLAMLEAQERQERVQAALLSLPLEQREVVILRYFADLSYDEIATTLGLPMVTVKSRLHGARQRLARLLANSEGYAHAFKR